MKNSTLHIVAFNIPFPANYGGVIDVFYKIKALHQQGVQIILHTFQYGRKPSTELEKYCTEVYYYNRPVSFSKQLSSLPFIVKTRDENTLLENLKKDNHPILFEGLHTCYFLNHQDLQHRKKYIRMHNVEWEYYAHLAKMESNILKKIYFQIESAKLRRFEKNIKNVNGLLAISKNDEQYFKKNYPSIPTHFVPAFHPNEKVECQVGKGDYILFHGDLSVKDNEEAAIFLLEKIAQPVDFQWVIAGLNPSEKLKQKINAIKNVELKANVSHEEMESLIINAHVNILLSFQSAGMKLKLLNALFKGRFCVVNDFMIHNSGLEKLCQVGNDAQELQNILQEVLPKEFSNNEIKERKKILETKFSNQKSAKEILSIIPL